MIGIEAGGHLVMIKTLLLLLSKSGCNYASWQFNQRSRQVCIKARSHLASLAFIGQVTKHTTIKWPVRSHENPGNEAENWTFFDCIYNLDFPGFGWISFNFNARPMFPLILILPWKKA